MDTAETASERGRLLDAKQIAEEVFSGTVSPEWVKRTVAPKRRIRLGHSTLRWYEADVRAWIEGHRQAA